jgi:hypothetical protein
MYVPASGTSTYKFLLEFVNKAGEYNQFNSFSAGSEPIESWVTFPMNKAYPQTIEPLSLSVLDASAIKNVIVYDRNYSTNVTPYTNYGVSGYGQIAKTNYNVFQYREGEWILPIYRNRFSNNASNNAAYDQSGITGDRIRCKTPFVQITIGTDGTPQIKNQLNIQSVKMEYKQSTGH